MPETQKTQVQSPKDPLEEEMAAPSNILAGSIPWSGDPDRLQPTESHGAGRDWETGHTKKFKHHS